MTPETLSNIVCCMIGLFCMIRFRYLGRTAIEQRKRLNKKLPFKQPKKDFNEDAVSLSQLVFFIIGLIFFLTSIEQLLPW